VAGSARLGQESLFKWNKNSALETQSVTRLLLGQTHVGNVISGPLGDPIVVNDLLDDWRLGSSQFGGEM